jgi:hypothetical protein
MGLYRSRAFVLLSLAWIAWIAFVGCSSSDAVPSSQLDGGPDSGADASNAEGGATGSAFSIGGNVTGLTGTGLVLTNNGGDALTIAKAGTFAFATKLADGAPYAVAVKTQPQNPAQQCAVTNGTGTVGAANVTAVTVTCTTPSFTISGTLAGLGTGAQIVLRDNGGDDVVVKANGAFQFATKVAAGKPYAVTVAMQPTGQACTVAGGTGTVVSGDVSSILVNCTTNKYAIGGTISGLLGQVVLQDNGGDDLLLTSNGTFAFGTPQPFGGPFNVTVRTPPTQPHQTCTIVGGTGTVPAFAISTIAITCTTNQYNVSVNVSSLAGTGLVLQNSLANNLSVTTNGQHPFAKKVTDGANYAVSILTQPAGPTQNCTLGANASGKINGVDIVVPVNCATDTYFVNVDASNVLGQGLTVQNEGADDLKIGGDGKSSFATPVADLAPYSVAVSVQPSHPNQTCTPGGNAAGNIAASDVTVSLACVTTQYKVKVAVAGLVGYGTSLVLENNGADDLTIANDGTYAFATSLDDGSNFKITVLTPPGSPAQTCHVDPTGTGKLDGSDATIPVTCDLPDVGNWKAAGGGFVGTPCYDGIVFVPASAGNIAYACTDASGAWKATFDTSFNATWSTINGTGGTALTNLALKGIAVVTNANMPNGVVAGAAGAAGVPDVFKSNTTAGTWNTNASLLDGNGDPFDITAVRTQASAGDMVATYDPVSGLASIFGRAGTPTFTEYAVSTATGTARTIQNVAAFGSSGAPAQHDYVAVYGKTPAGAAATGGVFESTDNGHTWTQRDTFTNGDSALVWTVRADPATFGGASITLYAGLRGGGQIYKSTDSGATWTQMNNGLPGSVEVQAFGITSTAVYAGTNVGLFQSTDGGMNWTYAGFGGRSIRAIAQSPASATTVFIGVADSTGLYIPGP